MFLATLNEGVYLVASQPVEVGADPGLTVTLSQVWWTFLISVGAPILTGLVTRRFAESNTKTVVLLLITAVASALVQFGSTFEVVPFLTQVIIAFFTAIGLHYQLLKPAGVTGSQGIVTKFAPDLGIGGNYPSVDLPEAKGGPGDDTYDGEPLPDALDEPPLNRDDPNAF